MTRRTGFAAVAGISVLIALAVGCGVELRSTGGTADASAGKSGRKASGGASQVVYRFFDEDFISGGYEYIYPEESKVFINERAENVKNGEASLQFELVANDYSGGAVCLYNMMYDLTPYLETGGALQFWIKGEKGGEIAYAALSDDENNDGKKSVVRLPVNQYGGIKNEWTLISIPLIDFGTRGMFWDPKTRQESPEPFQWDKVTEFRLQINKGENQAFRAWVDDIFIVSNVFEAKKMDNVVYWDDRNESIDDVPGTKPDVKAIRTILTEGNLPQGGFGYSYGGKTAYKVQPTKGGKTVFANYLDGNDWSGVTVSVGDNQYIDLRNARKAPSAGLAFWGKGAPGVGYVQVGILDNQGGDVKVQTPLILADFGKITTDWHYFMIPLRRFNDAGRYWDAAKQTEVMGNVDWSKIQEVRFSTGKLNVHNKEVPEGEPVTFYVSDLAFIEEIPGYVDPDDYWNEFQSSAPEIKLHDFETDLDQKWNVSHDEKSEGAFKFVESAAPNGGKKALEITYRLRSWVDVLYNYAENNRPAADRDWTKHWGLKFDFWTDRPYQPIIVQIQDSGNEIFVSATGGNKGWSEIIVPFRTFSKFPHYQPPDAVQNGKFDLDKVTVLDFKPAGEGSRGTFRIDNVRLTNDRVAKVKEVPAKVSVNIEGGLDADKVVTKKINPGIFGINVALWDGDLLLPATKKYVKDVNHHVLRYPGGLRADEDDWEAVLKAKDWMVDTDEFFEFLKETNTEGMITVNFGSGTAEKAAKWVAHAKAKKAPARLWEIGNELYGDWHPFHCSADEYGKKAREFAVQMKKADKDAVITAVWSLEGDWNKTVFNHVKDVIDGVNVHHYPQAAGQENDAGLLSAPQDLPAILGSVRKQLEDYGVKGKKYEIWLTEWNSVDFRPSPQTMTIVNALFVADYLGMLTKVNIEQASYWDVHNDITVEGGDYGYLSRTGAPDGDNVPRASYWAFKLASHSLGRGSVFKSETGDDNVTSYLTQDGKRKSLMIINKYPRTVADITVNVPGFQGKAKMQQLTPENSGSPGKKGPGPKESQVEAKPGMTLSLPAYSITTITIE